MTTNQKPSLEELKQKSTQAANEMNNTQFNACLWGGIAKMLDGFIDIASALGSYANDEYAKANSCFQKSAHAYRQINKQLQQATRKKNNQKPHE